MIHAAHENSLCEYRRVSNLPEEDPVQPTIELEQIETLRKYADPELSTLILTLAYQGWRISETLNVRRDKFYPELGEVERFVSKSREWHRTPLDPEVCAAWQDLPHNSDGRIFSYPGYNAVYDKLKELQDTTGIYYRPHMSRRSFATELSRRGADAVAIAQAGNWKNPKSVERYIQRNTDDARATLSLLRGEGRGNPPKPLKEKNSA